MPIFNIPGHGEIAIDHIVCDYNGTLATDGVMIDGVAECLCALKSEGFQVHVVSADIHGNLKDICEQQSLTFHKVGSDDLAQQKADYVQGLGAENVATVGNGMNDLKMFQAARLSVAIIGDEGAAFQTVKEADIVTKHIVDALTLFLKSKRLTATLKH